MNYSRSELIYLRMRCDESLMFFTKLFFKELRGQKFSVNDHHEIICDALDRVFDYKIRFLNITIPPRHSKTELVLNAIARGIGMNAKGNYLYITASDELRSEVSIRIRDIVSSPLFKALYSVSLKKDQQSKNVWRTNEGGGLKTATIFGQITGFGAGQMQPETNNDLIDFVRTFEGCIALDDIDKIMDAETQNANSKKTHNIIFSTILSRVNSQDTPLINIQQRAGEEDSTFELNEHFKLIKDKSKILNLVMPIIKSDGTPLWPAKMDLDEIEFIKTSPKTAHVFETQYMQNPTSPKGRPFHKSKLSWFMSSELKQILENSEGCISYIDPKDEGQDFYCHVFGHIVGETLYVTDVIHNQFNTDITVPKSIELIKSNRCENTIVETNSMGAMVFKWIRDAVRWAVRPINNSTRKETRIATFEAGILKHIKFLKDFKPGSEYESYIEKLTRFEYGRTGGIDDAPDATAGIMQFFMIKYRHLFKRKKSKSKSEEEE